jgi:hypothetical protein
MSGLLPNTFTNMIKTEDMFGENVMIRYGVQGDGTCFYYSLCAILNIDNFINSSLNKQTEIGRAYRCNFTKFVTWEEWNEFLQIKKIKASRITSMKTLKKKMCSYKVWADEPVIRFIMYKLKINLIFLDENLNKLYCGVTEPESDMTAVILWVNKSHFEPLGRLNALDIDKDKVAIQFQFYPDKDHDFIHKIMSHYKHQCQRE